MGLFFGKTYGHISKIQRLKCIASILYIVSLAAGNLLPKDNRNWCSCLKVTSVERLSRDASRVNELVFAGPKNKLGVCGSV